MAEITEQELKDMKLHEEKEVKFVGYNILMMRVVGGWIYWRTKVHDSAPDKGSIPSCAITGVFVPENVSSPASIS